MRTNGVSVATATRDDAALTLLFSLSAARSLADPAAAFADAREWSAHVGLIANDANAVAAFTRRHGITNDYTLRNWDKWGTMEEIRTETNTPRHVFVGTGRSDKQIAAATGWEYRPLREAAAKAGWERTDPGTARTSGSIRDRLQQAIRDRLL